MALGQLLASGDSISFASNEAPLPTLPPRADGEARVAIVVTELDAAAELVPESGDTAGLAAPAVSVSGGDDPFSAGIWRQADYPAVAYSTSATALSVRVYAWHD